MSNLQLERITTHSNQSAESGSHCYRGMIPNGACVDCWLTYAQGAKTIAVLATREGEAVALGQNELDAIACSTLGCEIAGLAWKESQIVKMKSLLDHTSRGYCAELSFS